MDRSRIDLQVGGGYAEDVPREDDRREEAAGTVVSDHDITDFESPPVLPLAQPEEPSSRRSFGGLFRPRRPAETNSDMTAAKQSSVHRSSQNSVQLSHEPRNGLYGMLWRFLGSRLYTRFGWTWLVRYSLRDRVLNALDDLWELRTTRKVIACVNSGGGSGKTTTTTWLTAAAGVAFKGNVVCIDANENAGHTADRMGVAAKAESHAEGDEPKAVVPQNGHQVLNGTGTLRLREFIRRRHQFTGESGRGMFLTEVDRHRLTGVFVIASNAIEDTDFDRGEFEEALWILKSNEQLVFADCGNGLKSSTNHGAVHVADTLVFPGTPTKEETLDDLGSTMERYANLGYGDKVSNGFVVILGDNPRKRKKYAKRYGVPRDHVIVFPVNRYMRRTDNPVSVERLPLRLQVILLEGLLAIVKS